MSSKVTFCYFLNSYTMSKPDDCVGCGRCYGVCTSKEDKEG